MNPTKPTKLKRLVVPLCFSRHKQEPLYADVGEDASREIQLAKAATTMVDAELDAEEASLVDEACLSIV